MASREQDAIAVLRDAENLLTNHRQFVRARHDRTPAEKAFDADEHERVTAALHRVREALGHLAPLEQK